jgi:hypothetical protein
MNQRATTVAAGNSWSLDSEFLEFLNWMQKASPTEFVAFRDDEVGTTHARQLFLEIIDQSGGRFA